MEGLCLGDRASWLRRGSQPPHLHPEEAEVLSNKAAISAQGSCALISPRGAAADNPALVDHLHPGLRTGRGENEHQCSLQSAESKPVHLFNF